MYFQCKLEYENGGISVLWVDEKYAKVNKKLLDEELNEQCIVSEVYKNSERTKEQVNKIQHMFKTFKDHDGQYK